jgi:hypothetical protein
MLNDALREELLAMRAEDLRVRQELVDSGELGGPYVPRMEAVHIKNAERLRELIILHGWPDEQTVGRTEQKPRGSLPSMQSATPHFRKSACSFCKLPQNKAGFRGGMGLTWKIESRCTRAAHSATGHSGWMMLWMAELGLGNSWMKNG